MIEVVEEEESETVQKSVVLLASDVSAGANPFIHHFSNS